MEYTQMKPVKGFYNYRDHKNARSPPIWAYIKPGYEIILVNQNTRKHE